MRKVNIRMKSLRANAGAILMPVHLQKNLYCTYREVFETYYPGQAEMIKDFWMPIKAWEGCNVNDPSARVLSNYGDSGK